MAKAAAATADDNLVRIFHETTLALVRDDENRDLSQRQLAVLLECYLKEGPHTVRGLAHRLNVSKPAITRALDRLEEAELGRRTVDPADRRSVLVQRTLRGAGFLRELRATMSRAAAGVKTESAT